MQVLAVASAPCGFVLEEERPPEGMRRVGFLLPPRADGLASEGHLNCPETDEEGGWIGGDEMSSRP